MMALAPSPVNSRPSCPSYTDPLAEFRLRAIDDLDDLDGHKQAAAIQLSAEISGEAQPNSSPPRKPSKADPCCFGRNCLLERYSDPLQLGVKWTPCGKGDCYVCSSRNIWNKLQDLLNLVDDLYSSGGTLYVVEILHADYNALRKDLQRVGNASGVKVNGVSVYHEPNPVGHTVRKQNRMAAKAAWSAAWHPPLKLRPPTKFTIPRSPSAKETVFSTAPATNTPMIPLSHGDAIRRLTEVLGSIVVGSDRPVNHLGEWHKAAMRKKASLPRQYKLIKANVRASPGEARDFINVTGLAIVVDDPALGANGVSFVCDSDAEKKMLAAYLDSKSFTGWGSAVSVSGGGGKPNPLFKPRQPQAPQMPVGRRGDWRTRMFREWEAENESDKCLPVSTYWP